MSSCRWLLRTVLLVCTLTTLASAQGDDPTSGVSAPPTTDPQTDVLSSDASSASDASTPVELPKGEFTLVPNAATQAEVRAHLASGRFRFCSEGNYRLWQLDKDRLCSRLPDVAADCPGLAAACTRPAWDEAIAEEPGHDWLTRLVAFLGTWGGEAFRAAFWLALALGALLLGRGLLRVVRTARDAEAPVERPIGTGSDDIDPTSQPATALLERASVYLEEGDARRALHFAYAALLAGLAQANLLRVHRALTSGDYRRALARSEPQSPASGLLWDLDLARFQPRVETDGARRLTLQVRELLSRLLLVLLTCGLTACASASEPEPPGDPNGPRGFALFEELASGQASTFSRRIRRITELPSGTSAVVVLSPRLRELEWATLERFVAEGGHLIAAGEAEGLSDVFDVPSETAACTAPVRVSGLDLRTPDSPATKVDGLRPAGAEVVIASCGSVDFARVHPYGDGQLTLVGDARFFDNTSLALADNASLVLALLESAPGHMEFVGPWTGAGAVHPLESIARSSVGPWLLHLLAVLALLAWSRGRRFGTPAPAGPSSRRSLLEHVHALAGHYQKQGDVGAALSRYSSWAVALLGKRSGSSQSDLRALSLALAGKRSPGSDEQAESPADLHQILLRARAAAELGGDKAKLMRAYRTLRRMVDEVTTRK